LLLTLPFPDRSAASKAEHRVKRLPTEDKRRFALSGGASIDPATFAFIHD